MISIPSEIIKSNLNSTSKLLFGFLLTHSENAISNKTISELSIELNVTHMTIRKALAELEKLGKIKKSKDNSVTMNKYKYEVIK